MTPSEQRKATPIFSGVLRYFPLALAAVSRVSKAGNDKHNPGEPLHWSREKSTDHGDCIVRHQIEFDKIDEETGEYHAAAVAWRALAQLELLEEAKQKKCTCTGLAGSAFTYCPLHDGPQTRAEDLACFPKPDRMSSRMCQGTPRNE